MIDEEAIDNFLLWQLCKQQGDIQRIIIEKSPDGEELNRIVEEVRREYREKDYNLDEKMSLLQKLDSNPEYRLEIFEGCSWRKETVKVEDLGTTLPRLGDLPPEVISGSLHEVIEFVREADSEEYRNVKYIKSLTEVPEILNQFYPWVVTPGNRPDKLDRMKEVHGERNWDIEDTWGMINDGNHRAIAKILAFDSEEIECYIGLRGNH